MSGMARINRKATVHRRCSGRASRDELHGELFDQLQACPRWKRG